MECNSIHLCSCPSIPYRCPFQRECIGSRLHVHIFGLNEAWRLVELHHLIRSVVIICTATCYLRDGRLTWSKQISGEEKDLIGSGMYKIRLSVCLLVGPSKMLCFSVVYGQFLQYSSSPNIWLALFITAPTLPPATWVAMHLSLFFSDSLYVNKNIKVWNCSKIQSMSLIRTEIFSWWVIVGGW